MSEVCNDIVTENSSTKSKLDALSQRMEKLETEQKNIISNYSILEGNVIDLQCRSMRENLLFTGIAEPDRRGSDESSEDPERVLRTFIREEMKICDEIEFDRVHRLGKWKSDQSYPRPIIAKFHRFKDRERVRLTASKVLKGRNYGVREQFPAEIEAVRRTLYPVAKKARENEENKVRLVRDRLFINDTEYKPKNTIPKSVSQTRKEAEQSYPSRSRARDNHSYQGTRVFKSLNPIIAPAKLNFTTPNRYSALNDTTEQTGILTESRKKKASSPLENDLNVKKLRETQSLTFHDNPHRSPWTSKTVT